MNVLKVLCIVTLFIITSAFADPKVVVVGAGLAGLTTAYRLQQQGVDVEVYEARSRVGGRVLSVQVEGSIAELGGQNIADGGEAENLCRLINEFALELQATRVQLNGAYFNGKKLVHFHDMLREKHFDPEQLKFQIDDLAEHSQNMRDILRGLFDEEEPLYKILAVRLAAYEGASVEHLSPLYASTLYHMLLGGLAAAHYKSDEETRTIYFLTLKGGNGLLPEKIGQVLGDRLHLSCPLTRVSKREDGSFVLAFQGDDQVMADIVVLAIPASVYSDICFEDQVIPVEKLEAIKQVQYGANAKILIPFAQPPLIRISVGNDRMVSYFDRNSSFLTIYYVGSSSRFSAKTLLSTYAEDRPLIEGVFGEQCPPFIAPVMAKDEAFAVYAGPIGYSWPNDPYAKGSYSCIAPGQETLLTALHESQGELVKTLFAPIDQRLYFAGEHASILFEAPGTMEAACESGERTARMILVN